MYTLSGDFGKASFSGTIGPDGGASSRYLSLNQQAALNFFKRVSILKTDLTKNSMGLFSFQQAGRNNEVRFASFRPPAHILQSRKMGCVWNPKGHIDMDISKVDLNAIEYNGEQCPDVFWEGCLEKIFGTGNSVRDFFATPEGTTIFGQLMSLVYEALGNSFYDLAWYGQHPLIADADTNEWYTANDETWADYVDQQNAAGGFMTIIDALKTRGYSNYKVPVYREDISEDGTEYIGTATDLFDRVLANQNQAMKMVSKRPNASGTIMKTVLLVDPRIFAKYEKELMAEWNRIDKMFDYYYNAKFCASAGCDGEAPVQGVLKYKGHLVVCMDEWEDFNTITGTNTFRVLGATPGVFGLGYDVPSLQQFNGLGLKMVQHMDAPWQGKIFMDTTFKMGMGIIDKDFLVNASYTMVPE